MVSDSREMAQKVGRENKDADYEQNAIDAVVRSWVLDDPQCQALALADAQVWATLHLARRVRGEPADDVVLEVTTSKPQPFPAAFCGETTEHERHIWTVEDASPFSPSTSLRECPGWTHAGDHGHPTNG